MNSKRIIVSIVAGIIAVVGIASVGNQAQAATRRVSANAYVYPSYNTSGVFVYTNNGQRPPQTRRVQVTPFKDFWGVLRYTR